MTKKNIYILLAIAGVFILLIGLWFQFMPKKAVESNLQLPSDSPIVSASPVGTITPSIVASVQPTSITNDAIVITPVLSDQKSAHPIAGLDSQTVFNSKTQNIYLNVFVKNAPIGMKIAALIKYVKTGDVLGPVATKLGAAGDQGQLAYFSFSKPTKGWPVGEYILSFTLANGMSQDLHFTVQ